MSNTLLEVDTVSVLREELDAMQETVLGVLEYKRGAVDVFKAFRVATEGTSIKVGCTETEDLAQMTNGKVDDYILGYLESMEEENRWLGESQEAVDSRCIEARHRLYGDIVGALLMPMAVDDTLDT